MNWQDIRAHYPNEWLLVEALKAHSAAGKRIPEQLAVLDVFPDSRVAMRRYAELHRTYPQREMYVLHTARENLEIGELVWLGFGLRPA